MPIPRRWILPALILLGARIGHAQADPRPAITLQIAPAASVDSAAVYSALRRGLEGDGLFDVVAARPGQPGPVARFMMHVGFIGVGNDVRADVRIMALRNATIVHRMSISAPAATMPDSLFAAARRCAKTLVTR